MVSQHSGLTRKVAGPRQAVGDSRMISFRHAVDPAPPPTRRMQLLPDVSGTSRKNPHCLSVTAVTRMNRYGERMGINPKILRTSLFSVAYKVMITMTPPTASVTRTQSNS